MKKRINIKITLFTIFLLFITINSTFAMNPDSYENSGGSDYTNHDVRVISNVTAEDLDETLGGVLEGMGEEFIDAGKANGIDPAFLAAIAIHESGNGTSAVAKQFNNIGGITCGSSNNCGQTKAGGTKWRKFSSVEESIQFKAEMLKDNYIDKGLVTIKQIQQKYAPVGASNDPNNLNSNWISGIATNMSKFGTSSNGGSGTISTGTGSYSNGNQTGLLFNPAEYFEESPVSITNVGVDDRKDSYSKVDDYFMNKSISKVALFFLNIAQIFSIFLVGLLAIYWLLAAMSFSDIAIANELLYKISFNKIDVHNGGFKKLTIFTIFIFIIIVLLMTNMIPKLVALVYSMLADITEFLSNISFSK